MDNPENHAVFQVNTTCNYDPDRIPFLDSPPGIAFIRGKDGQFVQRMPKQGILQFYISPGDDVMGLNFDDQTE